MAILMATPHAVAPVFGMVLTIISVAVYALLFANASRQVRLVLVALIVALIMSAGTSYAFYYECLFWWAGCWF